ncbi:MAG: type III PLP-dependent enzyme [Verrucomicrobiota bacterium]
MNPLHQQFAEEYGTPFYSYDLGTVRNRASELATVLPETANPRLLYSFKANPLPAVAGELRAFGCKADLTSTGEILAAREAGFDLSTALYGGPGKSKLELGEALGAGIRHFSIESWNDLRLLGDLARQHEVKVVGLLRVNPEEPPKARVAMAGVASQFGFEEADLVSLQAKTRIAAYSDVIDYSGFHIYWGTQVGDVEALAASFESAVKTAESLSDKTGIPLKILNLGGGFPWPYAHRGEGPDLSGLQRNLASIHANATTAREAQWWVESGRYLVGSSGTLVCRVMDLKHSKDRSFVVLDSGINHLGGMAGLGRIPRFSIDLIPEIDRGGEETVDVVGQLCTPLDCIGRNLKITELKVGDLVEIPNVGAYGLTASVTGFLSRPTPLEIAHREGEVESIHRLRTGHESIPVKVPQP